jgi:putative Mg2+ transporter-C (MgtC) family protein
LTTAASIWAAAGVGLACGGGLFWAAAITMVAILLVQVLLRFVEYRFFAHHHPSTLTLRVAKGARRVAEIERLVLASKIPLRGLRLRAGRAEDRIELALGSTREAGVLNLVTCLSAVDGVGTVVYRSFGHRSFAGNGHDAEADAFEDSDRSIA